MCAGAGVTLATGFFVDLDFALKGSPAVIQSAVLLSTGTESGEKQRRGDMKLIWFDLSASSTSEEKAIHSCEYYS